MGLFSGLTRGIRKHRPRVVMIGIDGVPYTLLKRFIDNGIMPNLGEIVDQGTMSQMDTSLPEVSSVAWTSFMTGKNPAEHGIYGFMDLQPNTYRMYFPNSGNVGCDTLWDMLGKNERRSIVINVPSTYPAGEIKGVLVSGFVSIDLRKATYPESAFDYLNGMGYRIDVDAIKARQSLDHLIEDLDITLTKRIEAIFHFWDTEEWDFFLGTITCTDRLHHFLWDALEDENHRYHSFFIDFYKRLDGFIGDIYDRYMSQYGSRYSPPGFILMSDHGFVGIKKEVYLNTWMRENGYLGFSREKPDSLEDIAEGTKAFVMDPSRIYINLKGKYPKGCVEPGKEYEDLRDELSEKMLSLKLCDSGSSGNDPDSYVVSAVYKKEDIYKGPYLDSAPDIVLLPHYGYDLKGSIRKDILTEKGQLTGMHTQDDAVVFINRKDVINSKPNIVDLFSIILRELDIKRSA